MFNAKIEARHLVYIECLETIQNDETLDPYTRNKLLARYWLALEDLNDAPFYALRSPEGKLTVSPFMPEEFKGNIEAYTLYYRR